MPFKQLFYDVTTATQITVRNDIKTYSEVVPEQLHYKCAVLVRVFVQGIQLSDGIIESLHVHISTAVPLLLAKTS